MRTFSGRMRIISDRMRIYLSPTRILSGRIRPEVCSLQNFFCSGQTARPFWAEFFLFASEFSDMRADFPMRRGRHARMGAGIFGARPAYSS